MPGVPFSSSPFGSSTFSASPFYSTKTIIDAVLMTTAHQTPANELVKRKAILLMLNNKYQEICMGKHWRWMFRSININLYAPYETGTVSSAQGSSLITGIGTNFDATMHTGGFFFIKGDDTIYTVDEVLTPTTLNLTTKFASADITNAGFSLAIGRYDLPYDVEEILSIWADKRWEMLPVGTQELRQIESTRQYGMFLATPRYYTIIDRNEEDDRLQMEFYPYPEKPYSVHMDYKRRILVLTDSQDSRPIIPDAFRAVLYYAALSEFFLYLKDPQSAALADGQYQRFFNRLMGDTALTDSKVRIQPGMNYRNRWRRMFRSSKDRFEFGRDD